MVSHVLALAEASCTGVVRTARGFVQDVGREAASRSTGLLELAARTEQNAERDCNRLLVHRFQLALPIPQTLLASGESGDDWKVPVLRLQDWLQWLVDSNHTHVLCGLQEPHWEREEAILTKFWNQYKVQHPSHPVYEKENAGELDLRHTFPCVIHGDEGRGRKRTAFLILSVHSLIGFGLKEKTAKKKRRKSEWAQMRPNFANSTLTTRCLMAALPKALYTGKNAFVWDTLMKFLADEAEYVLHTGVEDRAHQRGHFSIAILAVVGDWPFLADSGSLKRSYRNVPKHATRRKPPVGICHMCQAGQTTVDFEEINTATPHWLTTMFSQELHDQTMEPSPLCRIAHVPGQSATLFQFDLFHTVHLGVAKGLLGSFLALLSEIEAGTTVDERFEALTDRYMAWCRQNSRRPHVTKLSKELCGWPATTTYPAGIWHKGDLSTSLLLWTEHRYKTEKAEWTPMLLLAGEAGSCLNGFLRTLYRGNVWLSNAEALKAGRLGMDFLKKFARLARSAWLEQRTLWALQPKHHALHHVVIDLLQQSAAGQALNPFVFSCHADEDFIGRAPRLAWRHHVWLGASPLHQLWYANASLAVTYRLHTAHGPKQVS
eukprot:Skav211771  [mRNA]  locus=scaffold674:769002:770810:+ [translate_table: standard]